MAGCAGGGALIQKRNSAPAVCEVCRSLFQFPLHGRDAGFHAFMLIDWTHPFKIVFVNGGEFVLIDAYSFSQTPDAPDNQSCAGRKCRARLVTAVPSCSSVLQAYPDRRLQETSPCSALTGNTEIDRISECRESGVVDAA